MKIVKLHQVESIPLESPELEGVSKQVPVGVADGSPTMSMRVMTVAPKGYSPYHSHPWEHLNYVLAGTGVMIDEAGKETPISEGSFAFVAPDEKHQFRNTGEVPLQFICLVPKDYE
jgi:quercetin dioxygenase-like cupin family protein